MKSMPGYLFVTLLLVALFGCVAVTSPVPTTEEGKIADTEALIRVSLTSRILTSAEENYTNQVSAFLVGQNVPAETSVSIVNDEIAQLRVIEEQRLVDNLVPIYRRFYTVDEIHQLLSFYQTDVAKKSMRISGQIAAESQQYVRLWHDHYGDELLKRIYERLKKEGIEVEGGQ